LDWLQAITKAKGNVMMVAHNGRRFDFPILVEALSGTGQMATFCTQVTSFVDSLPMLKELLPGQLSYKQESLAHHLLKAKYDAHDAGEDVKALAMILEATNKV
jgi:DNA polymerase III alpha subunit (gram-positive type)